MLCNFSQELNCLIGKVLEAAAQVMCIWRFVMYYYSYKYTLDVCMAGLATW